MQDFVHQPYEPQKVKGTYSATKLSSHSKDLHQRGSKSSEMPRGSESSGMAPTLQESLLSHVDGGSLQEPLGGSWVFPSRDICRVAVDNTYIRELRTP